jgi:hypothetical protein
MNISSKNHTWVLDFTLALFMLIGCIIVAWGLSCQTWPKVLTFTINGAINFFSFTIVCLLILIAGIQFRLSRPIAIGALICLGLATITGAVWPLIVTVLFVISSIALGLNIISLFKDTNTTINIPNCFLIGAGVYGTIVGLLAQWPVNYFGVYMTLLAAPFINYRQLYQRIECTNLIHSIKGSLSQRRFDWTEIGITAVALVYIVIALMPELGYDALATHLFIPAQLSSSHKWGFDVSTYIWAVMPFLGDCIFSIGYMLAGETAARLINVSFIFTICWILRDMAMWAGGKNWGSNLAILILLSTPLTFTEGSSLYIESIFAAFAVGGIFALLRFFSNNDEWRVEALSAGILLGCALATKLLTITIFPSLLIILIYRHKNLFNRNLPQIFGFGFLSFLVFGSLPYIRSFWLTGNPVFPFFNEIFKSQLFPLQNFNNPLYNSGFRWDTIYRITFDTGKYLESTIGAPGFHWLVFFVPAILVLLVNKRWRALELVFISVSAVAITFQSQSYLRYVFPSFVLLTSVLGVFFSDMYLTSRFLKNMIRIVSTLLICINLLFLNAGAFYRDFPVKSSFSEDSRKEYLKERMPIRNAVELVNELNIWRSSVAVFSHPQTAGLHSVALYANWYNPQFNKLIINASSEADISDVLAKKNVDYIILDENWGTADKRRQIINVTNKVSKIGPISVCSLKRDRLYQTQLLKDPAFKTNKGWQLSEGAEIKNGVGAIVNINENLSQAIFVTPGQRYLNTVKARCEDSNAKGRLQVNWLDASSQFIKADIRVFDCSKFVEELSMEVMSPPKAEIAIVYCAGQTVEPVIFVGNYFTR